MPRTRLSNSMKKNEQQIPYTKMTKIRKLSEKDFKAAIMKMFQQAMANPLGTNGKTESFNKGTEDINKHEMEILERNNTIIKIRNSKDRLNRH